mgnify:CR=1 FL=1
MVSCLAALVKLYEARWQDEPVGEAHECLLRVYRDVRQTSDWRRDADVFHAQLYAGTSGVGGLQAAHDKGQGYTYNGTTLPYNVCRSSVDTLTGKISQHRPLPQVIAARGNWAQQKRAKKMTQFIEGEFYRQRVYEQHARLIIRDALVFGRGILQVWREGDKIRTERVCPWEVSVDEYDARYGDPRNIYRCRSIDRGVLKERFGRSESGQMKKSIAEAVDMGEKRDRHLRVPCRLEFCAEMLQLRLASIDRCRKRLPHDLCCGQMLLVRVDPRHLDVCGTGRRLGHARECMEQ